jgi:uncharacterized phage protein (TIGR01671 family)
MNVLKNIDEMKREIKFRAWDKRENKFSTQFALIQYRDGSFGIDYVQFDSLEYYTECNENVELLQFTGLKDKNGKEIYEGDIIREKYRIEEYDEDGGWTGKTLGFEYLIGAVYYSEKHAQFRYDNINRNLKLLNPDWLTNESKEQDLFHLPRQKNPFEIIGNIYENPELLKQ